MKLISTLFLISVFFSTNSHSAKNVDNKIVSRVHVNTTGGYYFKTASSMIDPDSCGSTSWYKLKNGSYTKEAFGLLLTAKVANKPVSFYLNGCSGTYPSVDWINVHD
jgi:hypothetical protein